MPVSTWSDHGAFTIRTPHSAAKAFTTCVPHAQRSVHDLSPLCRLFSFTYRGQVVKGKATRDSRRWQSLLGKTHQGSPLAGVPCIRPCYSLGMWLSINEAAALAGVAPSTMRQRVFVYHWYGTRRIGRWIRVDSRDVLRRQPMKPGRIGSKSPRAMYRAGWLAGRNGRKARELSDMSQRSAGWSR